MLSLALKSLWASKGRLAGTVLAVVIGISFLAGALALSDSLRASFNQLFTTANAGTDVVVQSATSVGNGEAASRPLIPARLVEAIRSVPGVADAQPQISGYGELIGTNGKGIGGNGPPQLAGNWITSPALNSYRLVSGRPPQGPNEVVINTGAATAGGLHVGDVTTVDTTGRVVVRIVGLATFGNADGLGKSTFAAFTLAGAEDHVIGRPGEVSAIVVQARPGVTQAGLASRLRPVLPPGVEAITGAQSTTNEIQNVSSEFLNALRVFLLVFAVIALVVATLSISNTLSIVMAQRTREVALQRAVGATRRQVLASVLAEAAALGAVSSGLGLLGGLGIAAGLKGLFGSAGFSLPGGGLVVSAGTVVTSILAGVVITVLASLVPALRASRVTPLQALRDAAAEAPSLSRLRIGLGLGAGGLGLALVVIGAQQSGSGGFGTVGLGALAGIAGMILLGPVAIRRAVTVVGSPLLRGRGTSGGLAADNVARNPRRGAAAATALMVGVAVVSLFTVLAASFKTSIASQVSDAFTGDLAIVSGGFGGGGMSPQLAAAVGRLPEVRTATGLTSGQVLLNGQAQKVSVVDPEQVTAVFDLHTTAGSIGGLGAGRIAVSAHRATAAHWQVGTRLRVTLPDGASREVAIGAIYQSRDMVGDYVLPLALWSPHVPQNLDEAIFVKLLPAASVPAVEAQVRQLAAAYGQPTVEDHAGFVSSVSKGVTFFVSIVYVLLVLAIIIAVLGISNTLALSIHERRREIGLLRAIGQTQPQLRGMIRLESVSLSLFGAIGGVGLGIVLGWGLAQATSHAQSAATFTAPVGQLVLILALGALAGILASARPSRRAARMPLLAAIADQ
jgi:putative ABC transport system permease protein